MMIVQWYSVKKYKPDSGSYLLRLKNKHFPEGSAFVVGWYNPSRKEEEQIWSWHGQEAYADNYEAIPTHFCIIPPLPFEDNECLPSKSVAT